MKFSEEEIDNYVRGIASNDARLEFESALEKDAELQEQVKFHRAALLAIQSVGRAQEKSEFTSWDQEMEKPTIPLYRQAWFAVAASLLLLLIPTYFLFLNGKGNVYEQYYSPFPNYEIQSMRDLPGEQTDLERAYRSYENQEWEKAIQEFEKLIEANDDPSLTFYLSLSYQAKGAHNQALVLFDQIDEESFKYSNALLWYRSLSLIALDRDGEGVLLLKRLEQRTSSSYAKQASALLSEL